MGQGSLPRRAALARVGPRTDGASAIKAPGVAGRSTDVRQSGAPDREYLLVLGAACHRLGPGRVAAESALCEHLRLLRRKLQPHFQRLAILAPAMATVDYEANRGGLAVIDEVAEGIRWKAVHPAATGTLRYWVRHFVPNLLTIARAVVRASCVHASTSHNVKRPFAVFALLFACLLRRPTICVEDIDRRRDARMNYATGRWSRKSYLLCRFVYDPIRRAQLWLAVRTCSLVLLKGEQFVADFGKGRPNVKNFYDTAFTAKQLIPPAVLEDKIAALRDAGRPLRLVYFGRLTGYKGVDRCIRAVVQAARAGALPLHFDVIGSGEQEAELRALVAGLDASELVTFHGAVPFGPELFRHLYASHLLLAAPLSEDTPRSAFDAMAAGVSILAFDTAYYADLRRSAAVDTVAWPSVEALAERIVALARDRETLARRAWAAVAFAASNTAQAWIDRRVRWTLELFGLQPERHSGPSELVADGAAVQGGQRLDGVQGLAGEERLPSKSR